MSVIQTCNDTNDALDLFRAQGLYLKPIARLNVSVQLPQLKKSGAKISNWEVMERAKEMAKPFTFPVFKVSKSSLEFIRFEAEIENYGSMEQVLAKLDMKTIKLSGFQELLKVRAAESKPQFPTRYDWDNYFIENKEMNEMKPGERPDTIHVQNLPTKWFINTHDKSGIAKDKPSEYVVKKVFGMFGEIRAVDIPMLDPYREKMKSSISGIQTFTFGQDLVFEAYIQFSEYIGFVKAMNSLKGMKLLYKDKFEERAWVANIKVDFDKSKHLAESTIKQRAQEREKLIKQEREREEQEKKKRELEEIKKAQERRKLEAERKKNEELIRSEQDEKRKRRMQREERRRLKKLGLLMDSGRSEDGHDEEFVNKKIELEERKLLVAQRKLESIRLLDELLERVKIVKSQASGKSLEADLLKFAKTQAAKFKLGSGECLTYKDQDEKLIRDKLVSRLKEKEKQKVEHFGERIKNAKETNQISSDDDSSYEAISDDDEEIGSEDENATEDDLRLTSTDEEQNDKFDDLGERSSKSKKKKKDKEGKKNKKDKKRKKKRKHSTSSSEDSDSEEEDRKRRRGKRGRSYLDTDSEHDDRTKRSTKRDRSSGSQTESDEEERKKDKMKRELENQIKLAKRISSREHVKTPPPVYRPAREYVRDKRRMICHETVEDRRERGLMASQQEHEMFPAYIEKVMQERMQKRLDAKIQKKMMEQQSEELYDRMMHPHLYGGTGEVTSKYKKPKRGEHYESTQQEILEEIKANKSYAKRRAEREGAYSSRYQVQDQRYDRYERDYDDRRDRGGGDYRGGYDRRERRDGRDNRERDYGRR